VRRKSKLSFGRHIAIQPHRFGARGNRKYLSFDAKKSAILQAGKRMTDPRLKPKPLRPDSRVWDRVEYCLQWLVWKLVVYSPEQPGLGAMITSVRLITFLLLIIGTGYGVWFLVSHL
jgi:hypothetical protein